MKRPDHRKRNTAYLETAILNILYKNLLECKRNGVSIGLNLDNRVGSLAKGDRAIFSCSIEHGQKVSFLGFYGDDLCFRVSYATVAVGSPDVEVDVPIEVKHDFDDMHAACRDVAEDPLGWCSKMAQVGHYSLSPEEWERTKIAHRD